MIIVPKKNLYLPERRWGQRKFQRGIIIAAPVYPQPGGIVVITDLNVSHFNSGAVCHAGFSYNRDGSIDDIGPLLTDVNQTHTGEWWSEEPETTIGDGYEVRNASIGAGTWTSAAAAVGVWVVMSATRTWRVFVTAKSSPNTKAVTGAVFEIKKTGGSVLDTSTNSASAAN